MYLALSIKNITCKNDIFQKVEKFSICFSSHARMGSLSGVMAGKTGCDERENHLQGEDVSSTNYQHLEHRQETKQDPSD